MYHQEVSEELKTKAIKWINRMDQVLQLIQQDKKFKRVYQLTKIENLVIGDKIRFSLKTKESKNISPVMIVRNIVNYNGMVRLTLSRPKFKIGLPVVLDNGFLIFKDVTFSDLEAKELQLQSLNQALTNKEQHLEKLN